MFDGQAVSWPNTTQKFERRNTDSLNICWLSAFASCIYTVKQLYKLAVAQNDSAYDFDMYLSMAHAQVQCGTMRI